MQNSSSKSTKLVNYTIQIIISFIFAIISTIYTLGRFRSWFETGLKTPKDIFHKGINFVYSLGTLEILRLHWLCRDQFSEIVTLLNAGVNHPLGTLVVSTPIEKLVYSKHSFRLVFLGSVATWAILVMNAGNFNIEKWWARNVSGGRYTFLFEKKGLVAIRDYDAVDIIVGVLYTIGRFQVILVANLNTIIVAGTTLTLNCATRSFVNLISFQSGPSMESKQIIAISQQLSANFHRTSQNDSLMKLVLESYLQLKLLSEKIGELMGLSIFIFVVRGLFCTALCLDDLLNQPYTASYWQRTLDYVSYLFVFIGTILLAGNVCTKVS